MHAFARTGCRKFVYLPVVDNKFVICCKGLENSSQHLQNEGQVDLTCLEQVGYRVVW